MTPMKSLCAAGLAAALVAGSAELPGSTADAYRCKPGIQFPDRPTKSLKRTEKIQRNENRTNRSIKSRFSSKRTKSVRMEVNANVKASYSAIFASAEASFGGSLAKETTAELGNEVEVRTPARRVTLARYGVYRYVFRGARIGRSKKGLAPTPRCRYRIVEYITAKIPADQAGWRIENKRLR